MTARPLNRTQTTTFAKRVVLFLTATVSSLALAQAVPTIGAGGSGESSKAPYRGTAVSYGQTMTPYNWYESERIWTQRIGITPEWHFNDAFAARARLYLSQELTISNTTNRRYEVELSDLWLDGTWSGWKEPNTGIRIAGDLRTTYPTSKASQFATRIMTVAPGANISRSFNVLGGLSLVYSARFTWRFNRLSTRQNAGGRIINCSINNDISACGATATGATNLQYDVLHGPTVSFSPHERFNIAASFFMQRGWVPPLAQLGDGSLIGPKPTQTRDFSGFSLAFTWQAFDWGALTLGAFTFAGQLDERSEYYFPLFNRNTQASLDATFDLEAIVSSFTKEKK